MLFKVLYLTTLVLFVLSIQQLIVRFWAKRDGFRPVVHNLDDFGPVLLSNRWGSVAINNRGAWQRTVTITLFRSYIHLKLLGVFGGGELLIPLQAASYSFSSWMRGELVDIMVYGQTYRFGRDMPKIVKQHYC